MEKVMIKRSQQLLKTQILFVFLFMVFSFSIAPNLGAQDAPLEVIQAAKLGLPIFLDMFSQQVAELPLFKIEEYGFEESDSLNQAYLGEAFRLYWISRDVILNYQRNTPVESVLSKTDLWHFLVMIDEEVKAILTVDKMKGSWQAVALGQANLATELGKIRQQWPREKGYTPLLITCYQPYVHLFTVPQYDAYNLTFLSLPGVESAGEEGIDYSTLSDAYNVIKELR